MYTTKNSIKNAKREIGVSELNLEKNLETFNLNTKYSSVENSF